MVGLSVSLTGFQLARTWADRALHSEFQRRFDAGIASLKREIDINLEVVRDLGGLFHGFATVSRRQFHYFAGLTVARHPSIQALEWIPRVPRTERAAHESTARADGLTDYRIAERRDSGALVGAGERDAYFPVYYVEPLAGNEAALGFDLGSDSARRRAIERARDGGELAATAPIKLVQEDGDQVGLLVFAPVFDGAALTVQDRGRALRGFASGVYRAGDLFTQAMERVSAQSADVALRLADVSPGKQALELHRYRIDHAHPDYLERPVVHDFPVADRVWRLSAWPTRQLVASQRSWLPHGVLFTGLVLTLVTVAYLRTFMQRESEVRRLVALRTEEIEAGEHRTSVILDTAIDAIITADRRGVVQRVNPAAERLFGYTAGELMGRNVSVLMPEPYSSEHDAYLERYQRTGEPHIIGMARELTGRRKDGSTFPMKLSVGEAKISGGALYVGVIADITQQRAAEEVLRQAKEQAEENSRLKSEFVNMMSHELRTPMTVILGYLPLLKNESLQPEPPMIAGIARDIESSAQHLLHLINDLLDISRIEAGKMPLNRQRIAAAEVVQSVVEGLRSKAREKGIGLAADADGSMVFADPVRLRQILINLMGNAVKFTDRGKVEVSSRRSDGVVSFEVRDSGCGIAADQLPHIFDKFHQADSSSTRAAGGSGLGLAITQRLVELHGGRISVDSVLGEGTVFSFSIPEHERKGHGADTAG